MDGAGVHASYADAPHIIGMIDGHALHSKGTVHVRIGGGHGVHYHVKQRVHVRVVIIGVKTCEAVGGRGIDDVLHRKL